MLASKEEMRLGLARAHTMIAELGKPVDEQRLLSAVLAEVRVTGGPGAADDGRPAEPAAKPAGSCRARGKAKQAMHADEPAQKKQREKGKVTAEPEQDHVQLEWRDKAVQRSHLAQVLEADKEARTTAAAASSASPAASSAPATPVDAVRPFYEARPRSQYIYVAPDVKGSSSRVGRMSRGVGRVSGGQGKGAGRGAGGSTLGTVSRSAGPDCLTFGPARGPDTFQGLSSVLAPSGTPVPTAAASALASSPVADVAPAPSAAPVPSAATAPAGGLPISSKGRSWLPVIDPPANQEAAGSGLNVQVPPPPSAVELVRGLARCVLHAPDEAPPAGAPQVGGSAPSGSQDYVHAQCWYCKEWGQIAASCVRRQWDMANEARRAGQLQHVLDTRGPPTSPAGAGDPLANQATPSSYQPNGDYEQDTCSYCGFHGHDEAHCPVHPDNCSASAVNWGSGCDSGSGRGSGSGGQHGSRYSRGSGGGQGRGGGRCSGGSHAGGYPDYGRTYTGGGRGSSDSYYGHRRWRRHTMFGKQFSSDITGDGPCSGTMAVAGTVGGMGCSFYGIKVLVGAALLTVPRSSS